MSTSGTLKPADDYRKYFEADAALSRRFQPVLLEPPTELQARQMLEGLREAYERHHKCVYEPAALDAAVSLSTRYIADRQLPDKVGICAPICAKLTWFPGSCCWRRSGLDFPRNISLCPSDTSSSLVVTHQQFHVHAEHDFTPDVERHHLLMPCQTPNHLPQAIDVLDEAGSRARIAAYLARGAVDASGRPGGAGPWAELQDVLAAKAEAAQVRRSLGIVQYLPAATLLSHSLWPVTLCATLADRFRASAYASCKIESVPARSLSVFKVIQTVWCSGRRREVFSDQRLL